MDAFITRNSKKRKSSPELQRGHEDEDQERQEVDEPTDVKLAMLSSLRPELDQGILLDLLLAHDGSVKATSQSLRHSHPLRKKTAGGVVSQMSLRSFAVTVTDGPPSPGPSKKSRLLPRKGATLHLFDPQDIAEHTPCSIIHNFLPPEEARDLLLELLKESESFEKITFKLFDNVVSSPHTSSFYVGSYDELNEQMHEYVYNGARLTDVRQITPQLDKVKDRVREAVNREIAERIRIHHGGKKLKHQSSSPWSPNAAFVNCYNGPQESVGWHSDQLTYLGPRAVIGSLSLGVTREFRVRRVLPRDSKNTKNGTVEGQDHDPDAEGQIAIHLPHNSLLVMHAEMQEEWKHSIAPVTAIDPHPVAGNRRINVTYRDYREAFHPRCTPRCSCDIPCVLRVVQKKRENRGRYFWMCHAGNVPGKEGCSFFQWAEFDDEGNPIAKQQQGAGWSRTEVN